jgi:hypothetical protein
MRVTSTIEQSPGPSDDGHGEGEYVEMERVIQKLLKENGADGCPPPEAGGG